VNRDKSTKRWFDHRFSLHFAIGSCNGSKATGNIDNCRVKAGGVCQRSAAPIHVRKGRGLSARGIEIGKYVGLVAELF
jgi:hypothetical protein